MRPKHRLLPVLVWGMLLPPVAAAAAGCPAEATATATVRVATAEALQQAIATACAGQNILIAPGRYVGAFRVPASVAGTADRPVVIAAERGLGSVFVDGAGTDIVWKFSGSSHIALIGLDISGGGYHGVFFDTGAHDIAVIGNRIHDNHRTAPLNSHAEVKGSGGEARPARIVIRDNDIFHSDHPPGGNFQGIDCNRCDDFHIVGNHLHDIGPPTEQPYSYYDRGSCIQMKSGSRRTVIDGNRIERCHIGIVLGGEGLESPENVDGSVRNNLILDAADIGIAAVNAQGAAIHHNTVLGPGRDLYFGVDNRHADSRNRVSAANNLLSSAPTGALDDGIVLSGNAVIPGLTATALFRRPASGDFGLAPGTPPLDGGTRDLGAGLTFDYAGNPRPAGRAPDAGAVQRTTEDAR